MSLIPFCPGDESCICKGEGYIDHQVGTLEVPKIIRGMCPKCVKFKEATVETLAHNEDDAWHQRDGRVVPEER